MKEKKTIDAATVKHVEMCGAILRQSDKLRDINVRLSNVEHAIKRLQGLEPPIYGQYKVLLYMPDINIDIPLTDADIQPALTFMQQVYANTESRQASVLKDLFSTIQGAE